MDGSSLALQVSYQYYYEKSFFILQCLKNIVRLGLEKLFMKVGYYDTEQ